MRNGEPNVYAALATLRNGYMQMQWSRVQMYLVFNTIALPLVFGTDAEETAKFVISATGLTVHTLLPIAIWRGERWVRFFCQRMADLEQLDQEEGSQSGPRVQTFGHPDFEALRGSRTASRKLFAPIAIALELAWLAEVIRHAYLLYIG
ncbi:hypothetical protein A3D70_02050 [Candidatus Adlerbacteria bacterium RIFCSPHIGHO2_02_FULL_54_18]|uniref:Uncharacterized protein n=2 Tax=Candidatus Adleribacteriota TaxID=1752736 RepID=A0A1F4Y4T8_9BACT|nr:MAG: hypothetical protein A2949_01330 [Candidatus Adlerbacteria bacterium RIFCSPLOWO2_01_FULL_54_21b]OGC88987.1 MAG: hypothetical protein A3D70_02050 [Candidatus Adlerbacteria bacterium RIFCSPHIGHO2_02_FULL_54_18]